MSRVALNRCSRCLAGKKKNRYSRCLSRLKPLTKPPFFSSSAASNRDGDNQTGPPPIRVGAESAGRAVFATRRIGAGDLIHTAKSVVACPSLLKLDSVCYLCLKKLMGSAKFEDRGVSCCSQECQENSKGFLDVETRADWSSFVD
ncbi:hypothetical protein ISN45_Aa06g020440 [Arabidopsis thaliana x Arabidopsis arenosa]|uniref:Uncharacterized protein n=1 Tax=Arabidopsis thaliana x Arabidopsis arenosa TaxID=1240361 RepID=A0A8T1YYF4_9BRAS|nr:hypothetical protein ISN45_Aa06g020440 [Arabidopsis thaliana x Arabidopsis arenosa]